MRANEIKNKAFTFIFSLVFISIGLALIIFLVDPLVQYYLKMQKQQDLLTYETPLLSAFFLGKLLYYVLDWLNLFLAFAVACGAYTYFIIRHKGYMLLFGSAYALIGIMYAYNQLLPEFSFQREELYHAILAFSYWESELFFALALALGAIFSILYDQFLYQKTGALLFFLLATYITMIIVFIFTKFLFPFLSSALIYQSIIKRPLLIIPILIEIIAVIPLLFYLYKKNNSLFLLFILLSIPLSVVSGLIGMFNPQLIIDQNFSLLNYLKILIIFFPLIGLFIDCNKIYQYAEKNLRITKKVIQSRNDFVFNLKEELNLYLFHLDTLIFSLLEGNAGALNDKQKQKVMDSRDVLEQIKSSLEGLTDIAKIKTSSLFIHYCDFDLNKFLSDLALTFEKQGEVYEIAVHYESIQEEFIIHNDPKRLKQIFSLILQDILQTKLFQEVYIKPSITDQEARIFIQDTDKDASEEPLIDYFSHIHENNLEQQASTNIIEKISSLLNITITKSKNENRAKIFCIAIQLKESDHNEDE